MKLGRNCNGSFCSSWEVSLGEKNAEYVDFLYHIKNSLNIPRNGGSKESTNMLGKNKECFPLKKDEN